MYLTKTIDGFIEDHENGRTYTLSESLPDYDNNTVATTVYVRSWFGDSIKMVDLAHELDAIKLWDHLTSLCKLNTVDALNTVEATRQEWNPADPMRPDATKAQDAPQERYAIDTYVQVLHTAKCVEARGLQGRIAEIVEDPDDAHKETFWYVLDFHPQRQFPGTPAFEHDELKPIN